VSQTLKAFSTAMRSEIHLVGLTHHLELVVDETVQAEAVSLWLRNEWS
jgi:hypothetical protein